MVGSERKMNKIQINPLGLLFSVITQGRSNNSLPAGTAQSSGPSEIKVWVTPQWETWPSEDKAMGHRMSRGGWK